MKKGKKKKKGRGEESSSPLSSLFSHLKRDFLEHFSPSPLPLSLPVVLSLGENGSPLFCQENAWVSITSISVCVCTPHSNTA